MSEIQNIIIGAGPAGLQLAYYFKQSQIKYLVIEQSDSCGSFFKKYPHSGELISINKRFTGNTDPDFNLRHDWNSLLNTDDFLFNEFSSKFYPSNEELCHYFNEFYLKYNLNIQFNTKIDRIKKENDKYYLYVGEDLLYVCRKLIVATGLSQKVMPDIKTNNYNTGRIKHYSDFGPGFFRDEENLKKYENKNIIIAGAGNSAFEIANILNNYCASITIVSRNPVLEKSSMITKYSGSLRMKYLAFMDTFYLKSMNAILDDSFDSFTFDKDAIYFNKTVNKDYLGVGSINSNSNSNSKELLPIIPGKITNFSDEKDFSYDQLICCTGWKFDNSIFDFKVDLVINDKYPSIDHKYMSTNNNGLYFIGNLMHSHDYHKSSGGFIHGFRYLIRLFMHLNFNMPYQIREFKFSGSLDIYGELAKYIQKRINTSSDLYQMHSLMCDSFYFDKSKNSIIYYHNITAHIAGSLMHKNKYVNVYLKGVEHINKVYDVKKVHNFSDCKQTFLHIMFEIVNEDKRKIVTLPEDLYLNFYSDKFYDEIYYVVKMSPLIF